MTGDYSLYKLMVNIAESGRDYTVSRDEFLEKYKGSDKEAAMQKIFTIFDRADSKTDGVINLSSTSISDGTSWFRNKMSDYFFEPEFANENDQVAKGFVLDTDRFIQRFGEDVSVENFKEALEDLNQIVSQRKEKDDSIRQENDISLLKNNNKDIPEAVLSKIYHSAGADVDIKIVENNGETFYEVKTHEEDAEMIHIFDKEGSYVSNTVHNVDNGDDYGVIDTETAFFDEKNPVSLFQKFNTGVERTYFRDGSETCKFKKTEFHYNPEGELEQIIINNGLPNQTEFIIKMNNAEIDDISAADNQSVLKMSDETKNTLKKLYNNGLFLGVDFNLEVRCNEIVVSSIKDEDMPDALKNEIDKLTKQGCKKGIGKFALNNSDYKMSQMPNGNYAIVYLTHSALDYSCDKKRVVYSPDGSIETVEMKNDKLLVTKNGETHQFELTDIEAQRITNECFGFTITKPDDKDLLNYERFKIEESGFSKNLYQVGKPEYISDTEYTQKIGNNEYRVSILSGKISVQKNGKEFFISTEGISEGAVKFISQSNPDALYTIAKHGVSIKLQAPLTGGDGEFIPDENAIYIAPDASEIEILQRRIAHEVGHIYYTHKNAVNKELEEMFKQESEAYEKELAEVVAKAPIGKNSFETELNKGEVMRNFSKWSSGDARYCATNVYEFVAEAYCLLVTGNAKSAFTIANVYPKTFAIVKKMIQEADS